MSGDMKSVSELFSYEAVGLSELFNGNGKWG